MLLMCCRLQELDVSWCVNMTDSGLLEGIGSLQELTSLRLTEGHHLTAQALSTFLHRPSMTSIVLMNLSNCYNLDDEGLTGIAKRCNKLRYLHIWMQCKCLCVTVRWVYCVVCVYRCVHLKELEVCFCEDITDAGISSVTTNCTQLRALNMWGLQRITGVCSLWSTWTYIVFYNYGVWYS
jgi:hypothetical protein